jgi:hypothetical protein
MYMQRSRYGTASIAIIHSPLKFGQIPHSLDERNGRSESRLGFRVSTEGGSPRNSDTAAPPSSLAATHDALSSLLP